MHWNQDGSKNDRQAPDPRAEALEELQYRLRQQDLVADFGLFALRSSRLDTLLQEAAGVAAQGLGSSLGKVLEYLPDRNEFIVRAGVGWKPGTVGRATVGADLQSPAGYAFHTGRPLISNHLENEDRFRTPAVLVEHGVKRAINVLIQDGEKRFGVLEVDSPDEGKFSEPDTAFLQSLSNQLGVAIERQKTEDDLRRNEALLREAIEHQELLTSEISHRVKNSLALVGSLLRMQAREASSPEIRQVLDDAQMRVQAIASVHDRLWRKNEVATINLAGFLGDLCDQLRQSGPSHTLSCDIASVSVPTDRAVPLGLILNELVTNALKYAYPEKSGDVHVLLSAVGQDDLRLEVRDRGVGMASDVDPSRSTSLGMRLIHGLTEQLGGTVQIEAANPGTRFVIQAPLNKAVQ